MRLYAKKTSGTHHKLGVVSRSNFSIGFHNFKTYKISQYQNDNLRTRMTPSIARMSHCHVWTCICCVDMRRCFGWIYNAVAKRTIQYNNFFVANNPDHPDGPASSKEDGTVQKLITSLIFIMWQVVEMNDAVTQPVSSILDCRHPRFSFQPTTIVAASQITPQQQTHDNNGAVKPSARIEMSLKSFLPTGC